jgi:Prokaryotic N-terminal methylation motif
VIPRREAGVTLMELLIAVTLVALLATGMLLALRVGLSAMDKSNARLMANRRAASVERIVESEIGGIMPVKALCTPTGESPSLTIPFFQGDLQAMRIVSSYSLQQGSRGLPMILEFHVIPGEEGRGVRLVVNEHTYTGPLAAGAFCAGQAPGLAGIMEPVFLPIETGASSFVLADKLAYCRFSYRLLAPQSNPMAGPAATWLSHWAKPFLPSAIRLEIAPLDPDSARAQLVTFTIPVHVTRDPMKTDYGR